MSNRSFVLLVLTPLAYTAFSKIYSDAIHSEGFFKIFRQCILFIVYRYYIVEFGPIFLLITIIQNSLKAVVVLETLSSVLLLSLLMLTSYETVYLVNDIAAFKEPEELKTPRLSTIAGMFQQDLKVIISYAILGIFLRILIVLLALKYVVPTLYSTYVLLFSLIMALTFAHSFIPNKLFRSTVTMPSLRMLRILWFLPFVSNNIEESLSQLALLSYSITWGIVYTITTYVLPKFKVKIPATYSFWSHEKVLLSFTYVILCLLLGFSFNYKLQQILFVSVIAPMYYLFVEVLRHGLKVAIRNLKE